eukprot:scaffold27446_cov21-Tisochrysis_lutea.AAC.1
MGRSPSILAYTLLLSLLLPSSIAGLFDQCAPVLLQCLHRCGQAGLDLDCPSNLASHLSKGKSCSKHPFSMLNLLMHILDAINLFLGNYVPGLPGQPELWELESDVQCTRRGAQSWPLDSSAASDVVKAASRAGYVLSLWYG